MRNTNIPTHVELPTSERLVRSTVIALAASAAILVAVVLPAEYGVDPTGVGRALSLTHMGEIKMQLAEEAKADEAATALAETPAASAATSNPAVGQAIPAVTSAVQSGRSDEIAVNLEPGQGAEVKLIMVQGAKANYSWSVSSGVVNFDLHGDGGGRSISYEKGRALDSATGVFEAAFDGNHGWYWRNRGTENVTVTLRANGAYTDIKRVI